MELRCVKTSANAAGSYGSIAMSLEMGLDSLSRSSTLTARMGVGESAIGIAALTMP